MIGHGQREEDFLKTFIWKWQELNPTQNTILCSHLLGSYHVAKLYYTLQISLLLVSNELCESQTINRQNGYWEHGGLFMLDDNNICLYF